MATMNSGVSGTVAIGGNFSPTLPRLRSYPTRSREAFDPSSAGKVPSIESHSAGETASLRCKLMPRALGSTKRRVGDMNERPRKATRLSVSLEEQDYRTLNEIALARDASVSWVIRQAIRQFIETAPRRPDQPAPTPGGQGGHGNT